jgi:hypothetical protein
MATLAQDIGPNKADAGEMQEAVLDIGRQPPHALLGKQQWQRA